MLPMTRRPNAGPRPLPARVVGTGPDLLLLPGFGLSARTYARTVDLLSRRTEVLIPDWLEAGPPWSGDGAVASIEATLDAHGLDRPIVVAHSFGAALAVRLAARRIQGVDSLVLTDSNGLWGHRELALQALRGSPYLLRLATPRAAVDFARSWLRHPASLARAGWWGFESEYDGELEVLAEASFPKHVIWASRDTLISQENGRAFAEAIQAIFTVVESPRGPTDHDWMFRHPELFVRSLDDLGILPES